MTATIKDLSQIRGNPFGAPTPGIQVFTSARTNDIMTDMIMATQMLNTILYKNLLTFKNSSSPNARALVIPTQAGMTYI